MSENLSIEEILREAEEIRNRLKQKTEETIEEIKEIDKPIINVKDAKDIDEEKSFDKNNQKTAVMPNVLEKTAVVPNVLEKTAIVPEIKEEKAENFETKTAVMPKVSEKTAVVPNVSEKTAVVPKVSEKTAVMPKAKKKSFFKHNSADMDFNENPPEIIEKPATIRSKSRFDNTSDLQEIPTILAVEELEKTRVMLGGTPKEEVPKQDDSDYDNAQIKLSGFDDEVDKVPEIDENVAESMLKERREDKVNKFRLFAQEEVDKKEIKSNTKIDDFNEKSSREKALEKFSKRKSSSQSQIAFTFIIGILLILLTVFEDSSYLPSFLANTFPFYVSVIALYAFVMVANIKTIIHGFNFKHGINFDFPIAFGAIITMVHTVLLFVNPDMMIDGGALYPSVATFALLLSSMGKFSFISRLIKNFEFLTDGKDKYTIEDITNEVEATIISRGLLAGDPLLKHSVKADFPTSFVEISCADEPADKINKYLEPILIVLNMFLFVGIGIMNKNWYVAFNVFTAGILISTPVISLFATNSAFAGVSKEIEKNDSIICGFEGAHMLHNSNALVMEANDLFGARSCDLHGVKTFNGTKIDDAILQTAAVIIKTNSPLAYVFDNVIIGKQSILPEVKDVVYEDKMGTSAWIYNKKILVGNRNLLIRHGISVPKEEYEERYTRKGRKALYLAVAGKIAAMFIISYSANPDVAYSLKRLEKSGITVILKSCDPYIDEDSVRELFELPEGFIRVMNSASGRVFEKYSHMTVKKSPAYAVHDGSALGFISSIRGSETLVGIESIISVLASFGAAIGFGIVALLSFIDGLSQINAVNVIIFQSVWSIFLLIVTKIKKNGI